MALTSNTTDIASSSLNSQQKDIRRLRTAGFPTRQPSYSPSVQAKAKHNSTHSNFGKGDEIVDAKMMMSLRRRIEALRRQEVMVRQEEPLHEYGTMGILDNNWLQWERDYKQFYQEEVSFMMARFQEFFLRCRPSLSITLFLCICVCLPIGAFHLLSILLSFLLHLATLN